MPFLLKKKMENMNMYEPGILDNIMSNVPKASIKRAIIMTEYRKWHKENEMLKQKEKKKSLETVRNAAKLIIKLENEKKEIDKKGLDGPAQTTISRSKIKNNDFMYQSSKFEQK